MCFLQLPDHFPFALISQWRFHLHRGESEVVFPPITWSLSICIDFTVVFSSSSRRIGGCVSSDYPVISIHHTVSNSYLAFFQSIMDIGNLINDSDDDTVYIPPSQESPIPLQNANQSANDADNPGKQGGQDDDEVMQQDDEGQENVF